MKLYKAFILTVLAATLSGCINCSPHPNSSLENFLAMYFFECEKCQSLDGGWYAKKSVQSWRSDKAWRCRHRWIEVDRADFEAKWQERAEGENARKRKISPSSSSS